MKIIITIFNVVVCLLMLAVALLFVTPLLPLENNIELRIVKSGSMEPSIMTGAIVIIAPHKEYRVGDVITFESSTAKVPTTHRISEIYEERGQSWFITKGDANEETDTAAVAKKDIIGTVMFDVPYAGYILDFSRQPLGFFFLIVLPALVIVFGEIEKIWSEIRSKKRESDDTDDTDKIEDTPYANPDKIITYPVQGQRMMDIGSPVRYSYADFSESEPKNLPTLKFAPTIANTKSSTLSLNWKSFGIGVFVLGAILGINLIPLTMSYPNDIEKSPDNTLVAVSLDFKTTPDGYIYSFINGELSGDEDGALVMVVAPEAGSVPVRYSISVEVMDGSQSFCNAIQATTDDPFIYNGSLTALVANGVYFDLPWSLNLSLPNSIGLNYGDTCQVDIVYTAWHYDMVTDEGYFDEERVPLSFTLLADVAPATSFELQSFSIPLEEPLVVSDESEPKSKIESEKTETIYDEELETEVGEVTEDEETGDKAEPEIKNPQEEPEPPEVIEESEKEEAVAMEVASTPE